MIGIAHLPRGEDSPDSVANQGGTVFGKTLKKDLWYAHSGRAIPYDPTLIKYARENRKSGNPVENRFWYDILRSDQLRPYRFTRQKPLLSYIVDFYSSDLGIVIELDGESHVDSIDYDQDRTDELEKY